MKVVRVDKLGDVCAFKPKEIQVVGSVYDVIPKESLEDFESVLNSAKESYDKKVVDAKSKGMKPKSAQFKAEAIAEFVKPFLAKFGVEGKKERSKEKVIKSKEPKITDAKDPVSVDLSEADQKKAEEFYDSNFSADMLNDSAPQESPKKLDDDLDDLSDDFDLDDDFNFDGLDVQ